MGNTTSLSSQSLPGSALQLCLNSILASSLDSVSYPQDFFYQSTDVKPYNLAIPITPAAVTRPHTSKEVSEIVKCAAAQGVKVQPRSGGHSYGNYGIGGESGAVVVDLVNFQQFSMNTSTWQATIGAGTLLEDVTTGLHNNGKRAIAHGTCPQVGIGGHATIGGLGPLSRQWGSALDHIVEVEVVLANGTITRANNVTNPDVFFAVKGAAASFGIVTEFVVQTHPEPTQVVRYSYRVSFGSHAELAGAFAAWQSFVATPGLDWKFATEVIVLESGMIISGTYFGTLEEYQALGFEAHLSSQSGMTFTGDATLVLDDWLGVVGNWAETEALQLVGGVAGAFYSKSLTFKPNTLIPAAGIEDLFKYFDTASKGTLLWFVIFDLAGGAINEVPQDATAYAHRDALFYMQSYAIDLISLSTSTRDFITGINQIIANSMPGVENGAYAGYVDPLLSNAQEAYWGTNLPKLERIKKVVDPGDVFHNPQSVRPAT